MGTETLDILFEGHCILLRMKYHFMPLNLKKELLFYEKQVGQSSPNPKRIEEQKNSLGQLIYQKCVTVVVSEETA